MLSKMLLSKNFIFFCLVLFLSSLVFPVQAELYDRILVKIRNRVITQNEVEMSVIQKKQQQMYLNKQDDIDRKMVLKQLIEDELLDIRADELNMRVSDDELDDELDRFRKKNKMNEQTFEELLEHQKMSLADYRKMFTDKIRRGRVVAREVRSRIVITEKELKQEYEKMESDSLQYRARHILRSVPPSASKEQDAKAKNEIIWVKDQIDQGASFENIADQYSQDPSVKINHGDLGYFNPGDMVKEFSDMVQKLKKNTLSPPVRTQFGYHLIQVIDTKQAPKAAFEKVKEKIRRELYQKRFEAQFETFLNEMKKRISIKHLDKPSAS